MQDLLGLSTLTLLGYMAAFHVLGGGALGIGARQWRTSWTSGGRHSPPFLAMWGVLFGVIPLAMGAALQDWTLLAGQAAILLVSFVVALLFSAPVRDFFGRQHAFMIGFGVLFMAAGGITSWLMLRGDRQTVPQALAYGSLFFLVGTLALSAGLAQWTRRSRPLREKPVAPPASSAQPAAALPAQPAAVDIATGAGAAAPKAGPTASGATLSPIDPGELPSPVDKPIDPGEILSPVDEPKPSLPGETPG